MYELTRQNVPNIAQLGLIQKGIRAYDNTYYILCECMCPRQSYIELLVGWAWQTRGYIFEPRFRLYDCTEGSIHPGYSNGIQTPVNYAKHNICFTDI
jgi:hypothetical protein